MRFEEKRTYLWKNWLKMPPRTAWSEMLWRRATLASLRLCWERLSNEGMKPELCGLSKCQHIYPM